MLRSLKKFTQACAALCLTATVGFAAPVLTNGGFEDNPPSGFGNNIGHSIAPWVLGAGDRANVVKVDDGGRNYGPHGPQFDATNPGVGVDQHYLDIADGSNDFYQEFTPLCDGNVEYGAFFSRRPSGALGVAGITLLHASDDSVAEVRQSTSLPLGTPRTDPWTRVAYQTTLVANTTYKFYVDMDNDMNIDNAFVVFLDQCDAHEDPDFTTGVPDETPPEETATSTVKTCEPPEETATGLSAACTITVTHGDENFENLQLEEIFGIADSPMVTSISALTSNDGWVCSAVPPASDLDAVTCDIAGADVVAGATTTIDVTVDLSSAQAGEYMNCAQLTGITSGEAPAAGTDQVDNAEYFELEPSCTTITVVKDVVDDVPPPPKPAQCTPFEAEVTCDERNGGYVVSLANSLSGTFDPNLVEVDVLSAGVSAVSHANNPLRMQLIGANPGDTVLMSVAATDQGGGSAPGLDLCCMGEVSVTVPEGLVCDPPKDPPSSSVISVSKTCEPTAAGFGAGNTVCHMDVTYSGPAPTPANPIVVTDAIASGSGVTAINAQDPTGAAKDVWACNGFGAGPVTCEMHNGIDGTTTAGYWDNYTTTLDLYLDADETYKNCAAASVTLPDGSVETAEDCHSQGDAQLEIVKTALFEVCTPGAVCQFEYTVNNTGSGDYNGAITLEDVITPIGGTFTAITPALCDAADLTGTGCTGNASIPAGGSVTYTVDYMAPSNSGPVLTDGMLQGENCVMLSDETMGEFDDPSEVDGHKSCSEFLIGEPDLNITKVLNGSCLPGEACNFSIEITSQGAGYEGNILLAEAMGGVGGVITSVTPALPAGCALPTDELGCILPVSVPAGGSYTLTVEATYDAMADGEGHNRNCAIAMTVPASVPTGPFEINAEEPAWAAQAGEIGQACVEFEELTDADCGEGEMLNAAGECVPVEEPEVTVEKVCEPGSLTVREGETVDVTCTLTVTAEGYPDGVNFELMDTMTGSDTDPDMGLIANQSGWSCVKLDNTFNCNLSSTDFNANGGTLSEEITLTVSNATATGNLRNCAKVYMGGGQFSNESCADIVVVVEDDVVVTPGKLDVAVSKSANDYVTPAAPDGQSFLLYPSLVSGTLMPGDVVVIRDEMNGLSNFATTTTQGAWTCLGLNNGQGFECIATVGANGAMPTPSPLVNGQPTMPQWENCGRIEVRRNGVTVAETNLANNSSCVSGEVEQDDVVPEIELTKSCSALPQMGAVRQYQCIITMDSNGVPFDDDIVITDVMSLPGIPDANMAVNAMTADAPWVCNVAPFSASNPPSCSIDPASFEGSLPGFMIVYIGAGQSSFEEPGAQNCAVPTVGGSPAGEPGCHVFTPVGVDEDDDGFPAGEDCDDQDPNVNPSAEEVLDGIDNNCNEQIDENLQPNCDELPAGTIGCAPETALDADGDGYTSDVDCDDNNDLVHPGAEEINGDGLDSNCDGEDDAVTTGGPVQREAVLTPAKALKQACAVSQASQTYTCEFELSVTNTGGALFQGPIALDDSFDGAQPTSLATSGEGWECMRTDGKGSSCLNGTGSLKPGQSSSMVMTTVIPSSPTGVSFKNCLAVGISESDFLRASVIQTVMQRLGIDGGPVDGAPGRKTREGIRQLQERLGLAPTGKIDEALFAAVGLPSAAGAQKVCVTVDLPPVKRPVRCDPPQVKNSKGVCYTPKTPKVDCPSGQVKNSKGQCYTPRKKCPSGQRLNSKGQCYTPDVSCPKGQKKNSKGQCYTPKKATSCDSRSTVQRGDACACRYSKMRKVNARSCVCRNTGLPPIRGVGCPGVSIGGGGGDAVEGDRCKLRLNGICVKR